MATFNFDIGQVNITNYLIVQAKEASNPGTIVDSMVYAPAHPKIRNVIFTGLNNVAHIFDFRESSDGIDIGLLLGSFNMLKPIPEIKDEIIFFKVGDGVVDDPVKGTSPVDGDDIYINPYFEGKTVVDVFKEGYRFLIMGDTVLTNEVQTIAGGGLQLLNGDVFADQQVWSVHVSYKLADDEPIATGSDFSTVEIRVNDQTLTTSDVNKSLLCSSDTHAQVVTLPAVATMPQGKGFLIRHDGVNEYPVNVEIKAQSGELIHFSCMDEPSVYLGAGEYMKVIKSGSQWFVIEDRTQYDQVGDRVFSDYAKRNSLVMGAAGAEYDGLVYKRLWWWINKWLKPAQIKSYAAWDMNTTIVDVINGNETIYYNRGFFAVDPVNKKIKIPVMLHTHIRGIKNIGGSDADVIGGVNEAGAFQNQSVIKHDHKPANDSNGKNYGLMGQSVGGSNTTHEVDTTPNEPNILRIQPMLQVGGSETTGRNIKQIPILLI